MTQTHSQRCILRSLCTLADSAACNVICASYIAVHGYNGAGGRVANANIPADYRLLTLQTSPARTEQAKAYELADAYATTFTRQFDADGPRIKSLYLYSEAPGTGKTTTAAALLNTWLITHYIGSVQRNRDATRRVQPLERPAYFLDVNAWQTEFLAFNRPRVPESVAEPAAVRYYSTQSIASTVPFLVADDIGVRDASDAFRADLHAIINERVTNALPTIYTSNVPLAELSRVFDARLADRIKDMCVEISFVGESKRGMR